jgi:hypothetical protein
LVDVQALGDELVVAHMTESAEIGGEHHAGHVAVAFRLVDRKRRGRPLDGHQPRRPLGEGGRLIL